MIHFFFTYTDDASDTPFAHALVDAGIAHAIYSRHLDFSYQHRVQLIVQRIPALLWYSVKSVFWSLRGQRPAPDIVIPASHLQALMFLLARWLSGKRFSIMLLSFIYTQRKGRLLSWLRQAYFKALIKRVDGVICHSELEADQYAQIFGGAGKYRFVPLGLNVEGHETTPVHHPPGSSYALSAGRSGRDYKTLCTAFAGLSHPLRIICDNRVATAGVTPAPNIQILDNCFGGAYLEQLRGADIVVIPLQVQDISAGQMVIIQAMALRKPIITTRTETVGHYARHEWNALLVEQGSVGDIQRCVTRLLDDPALSRRLAENAYQTFVASYSIPAFARAVAAVSTALHEAAQQARRH